MLSLIDFIYEKQLYILLSQLLISKLVCLPSSCPINVHDSKFELSNFLKNQIDIKTKKPTTIKLNDNDTRVRVVSD